MTGYEDFPVFLQDLPEVDLPFAGAGGRLLQGRTQQAVFIDFAETVDVPDHSHQEQWEFVVAGRVDLRIGGETLTHTAGDNFFIPAGEPHGATVHAGYKALIFFNAPDRYLPKD
ncbi:cupin domain-containing protein [bacterium]|nr:cupin domain-containing protein [bacterium]